MDLIPVLESDEQSPFQGLGREMGMEDIDLDEMFELKLAGALDLSRWELTDGPGGFCRHCLIPRRWGRPY